MRALWCALASGFIVTPAVACPADRYYMIDVRPLSDADGTCVAQPSFEVYAALDARVDVTSNRRRVPYRLHETGRERTRRLDVEIERGAIDIWVAQANGVRGMYHFRVGSCAEPPPPAPASPARDPSQPVALLLLVAIAAVMPRSRVVGA
jgi:hypothetical protein